MVMSSIICNTMDICTLVNHVFLWENINTIPLGILSGEMLQRVIRPLADIHDTPYDTCLVLVLDVDYLVN